ncbi:hypothetical protein GP486_005511, partial [Trichoglossum hirsutum]
YGLNGKAYTIHFFIGVTDDEIGILSRHPNHVGSVYTFSSNLEPRSNAGCDNCEEQKASGVLSKAQIHITSVLLGHALNPGIHGISSLVPDDVKGYLTAQLNWRIVEAVSGRTVNINEELPNTKIFVMKGTADHQPDDRELSRYRDYTPMWEPTHGKAGGGGANDGLVAQ